MRRLAPLLCSLVAFAAAAFAAADASGGGTVTISGRAYEFNHMDRYVEGATIRVRELPKLEATTDATGDYSLEVPDDATATPYIEPPDGYNQIDLQTFHTRGDDIENANFQTPADLEYNALAAIVGVPVGPDGRPSQCVIVTTASARNVRGVDYETFHERTPHGVPGARSSEEPPLPGPTYFNEFVIPDESETETSEDGGIIWTDVPAGTYRITTTSPETRFASFLATCEPGRIVNANPPWGAYELSPGEDPLGASNVAGTAASVRGKGKGQAGRRVWVRVRAAEPLGARISLRARGEAVAVKRVAELGLGKNVIAIRVPRAVGAWRARADVLLTDSAGESARTTDRLRLPAPR